MIKITIDDSLDVGNIAITEIEGKEYLSIFYRDKEIQIRVNEKILLGFGKDFIQQRLSAEDKSSTLPNGNVR